MSARADSGKVVTIATTSRERRRRFLAQVVSEHEAAIRRFLRARLACESDREDIAQEVFARLCRIEDLPDKLALGADRTRAYLFMIATNLIRDWHRRKSSHKEGAHDSFHEYDVIDQAPLIEERMHSQEMLERVERAIDNLPGPCRLAFRLSRFECQSYAEISDRMNISVSMVEKHISNALAAIRRSCET